MVFHQELDLGMPLCHTHDFATAIASVFPDLTWDSNAQWLNSEALPRIDQALITQKKTFQM